MKTLTHTQQRSALINAVKEQYNIEVVTDIDVYFDDVSNEYKLNCIGVSGNGAIIFLGCFGMNDSGEYIDFDAHYAAIDAFKAITGSDYEMQEYQLDEAVAIANKVAEMINAPQ